MKIKLSHIIFCVQIIFLASSCGSLEQQGPQAELAEYNNRRDTVTARNEQDFAIYVPSCIKISQGHYDCGYLSDPTKMYLVEFDDKRLRENSLLCEFRFISPSGLIHVLDRNTIYFTGARLHLESIEIIKKTESFCPRLIEVNRIVSHDQGRNVNSIATVCSGRLYNNNYFVFTLHWYLHPMICGGS